MFRLTSEYSPRGDQPQAIADLTRFVRARPPPLGAARGDGVGQDLHDRQPDRQRGPAHAGAVAQQDAGRPALQRVQGVLPRQRRGVLRLLLRLLPAGSVHPAVGHLHREGRAGQRRDRPHAPLGHPLAAASAGTSWWWPRSPASTASARPRPTRACTWRCGTGRSSTATRSSGGWSRMQYERNDYDFHRGTFRVRGDVVEVFPADEESTAHPDRAVRRHHRRHPPARPAQGAGPGAAGGHPHLPGQPLRDAGRAAERALGTIQEELGERLAFLRGAEPPARGAAAGAAHAVRHGDAARARLLPRHRELLAPPHRAAAGRGPADADRVPAVQDALVVIDESHVAVPQVRGMYYGDRSRKEALVEYGFRLPSAFDNRPLTFEEFSRDHRPDAVRVGHAGRLRAAS